MIFGGFIGIGLYANWRKTRCPPLQKHKLQRLSSKVIDRSNGTKTEEVVYKCRNCGHILRRKERSRDEITKAPRGRRPFIGGMGGGFLVATVEVEADLVEEVSEVEALEAESRKPFLRTRIFIILIVYTYEKVNDYCNSSHCINCHLGITSYNGMVKWMNLSAQRGAM